MNTQQLCLKQLQNSSKPHQWNDDKIERIKRYIEQAIHHKLDAVHTWDMVFAFTLFIEELYRLQTLLKRDLTVNEFEEALHRITVWSAEYITTGFWLWQRPLRLYQDYRTAILELKELWDQRNVK